MPPRSCTSAKGDDVGGLHRSRQALQGELTDVLGFDDPLDHHLGARAEQDLPGLRLAAEPGSEDRDVADGAVIVAAVVPDASQGCVAERDPDAESELIAAVAPRALPLL